ncbi:MAG: nucleotidyltransferase family protein [Acidilobaceae archaeon]
MDCSKLASEQHPDVAVAVLAGGEGKRFRPLTYYISKPLIPIGSSERPVIDIILEWITKSGVKYIVLLVGYKWRQLVNYVGDGTRYGAKVKYVVDKPPYSNTGGALRRAVELGLFNGYRDVLVWYGDIVAPIDIHDLVKKHRDSEADITLVVSRSYRVPIGVVKIGDGGIVVDMKEKPLLDLEANIGVFIVKRESIERILAESNLGCSFDISEDLIPSAIRAKLKVNAYLFNGVWYDVGSIERYEKIDHEDLERLMCIEKEPPPYVYL